jgi:TP901 family phage tail tape measure protein
MSRGDFSVEVGGDFSELLRGFQQIENRAQQAGQKVGQNLQEGIQKVDAEIEKVKARMRDIRVTQTKMQVDSSEWKEAEKQYMKLVSSVKELNKQKIALSADPGSLVALRAQLGLFQRELEQVAIGSARFRELQAAIKATEREMDRFNDTGDDLRLLEGAIGGIAFALTNAVVGSAGQAISALRNLVGEFATLDTELRKAAAAGGEEGGYGRLSQVVNEVGVEAAGTTLEVAQLATELVRGGMTIDQVEASLASIVRGAEATGTAFDQMGSVVSASIKGFGLQASDSGRVVDALVQGANASATSVTGLGMAFKYAAPVARILGVSVEELATAAGLLTNAGIEASEAGVTLRNGLSKLGSAAPAAGGAVRDMTGQAAMAARVVKQLGLDIYETDGTLKPMEETLLKLKGAFEGLEPATKIRMAANLFGGEDDGTKWLALLNQTEDEIRKMSATMALSAGATDKARDAMQGFELKTKQLGGTIGSIGNSFAALTAASLLPLLDAANSVAGAISELPEPVKNTAAALILLTGATVGATAAYLTFKRALEVDQVKTAVVEIVKLGQSIGTALAGGVTTAVGALPRLGQAIVAVSTIPVTFAPFLQAVKAGIVAGATQGVLAVRGLQAAITSGALLNGLKAFAIGAKGALVAFGPLAAAVGLTAAAVALWKNQLDASGKVSEQFAATQKESAKALEGLNKALGVTGVEARRSASALEVMLQRAREVRALEQMEKELGKLDSQFNAATAGALRFYQSLGNSGRITSDQLAQTKQVITGLQGQSKAAESAAARFRALAAAYDESGDNTAADRARAAATQYDSESRSLLALIEALRIKAGLTRDQIRTEQELAAAEQARAAAADLAATQKRTEIKNLQAVGALTDQQAQAETRLAALRQAEAERDVQRQKLSAADAEGPKRQEIVGNIAKIEEQIADLRVQGSQEEVQRRQGVYTLAVQLLDITKTKTSLEKESADLVKARYQDQLNLVGAILGLQSAQSQLTASGFDLERARQNRAISEEEKVLQLMRDRGDGAGIVAAQEQRIASLRQGMADIDRRALEAQITAATTRIELERRVLQLKQAQQAIDARNAVRTAEQNVNEQAQGLLRLQGQALDPNISAEQRAALEAQISLQRQSVGLGQERLRDENARLQTLGQLQAIEAQTLGLQAQTIANQLRAQAAAAGLEGVLADGLDKLDTWASASGTFADGMSKSKKDLKDIRDYSVQTAAALSSLAKNTFFINDPFTRTSPYQIGSGTGGDSYGIGSGRWTGGPVTPLVSHPVNELGQESFLSRSGALSLITAPAYGIWRPPAAGTVLPAGVTASLKARGAFDRQLPAAPSAAGDGNLRQSLDRLSARVEQLTQKNWNVVAPVPSNAGLLRTIAGI